MTKFIYGVDRQNTGAMININLISQVFTDGRITRTVEVKMNNGDFYTISTKDIVDYYK